MKDIKQAVSQESVNSYERVKEARKVEFLKDLKGNKKGSIIYMHHTGADLLKERYKDSVKVSNVDKEEELEKAKQVAGIEY